MQHSHDCIFICNCLRYRWVKRIVRQWEIYFEWEANILISTFALCAYLNLQPQVFINLFHNSNFIWRGILKSFIKHSFLCFFVNLS